jgi:hypothetical protein
MQQSYFINPKKGIYYTQKAYHDDNIYIDYVYVVDFDEPDIEKQFQHFLKYVRKDGADEKMQQLKSEFKALRELF